MSGDLILGASVITPFHRDGTVNFDAFRQQLDRLADAGLDLWLVSSGTAEANVLTDAEMDQLAEVAVAQVAARVPVYAMGREPRSSNEAISFGERMGAIGVDGIQLGPLDPGHSYMPTEGELRAFYDDVFSQMGTRCYLASHVSVGYEVPPTVLADVVAEHPDQVIGVNATHLQSYMYVPRLLEVLGSTVPVVTGSPVHALEGLALGTAGIVSSMDVNVAPQLYAAFGAAWASGGAKAINDSYATILRLFIAILGSGGLLVAKAVLDRLGLAAGPARAPRRKPDDATYAKADEIIRTFDLPSV